MPGQHNSYGIWNYILRLMPIPERNEANALIGRTLLSTNEVSSYDIRNSSLSD